MKRLIFIVAVLLTVTISKINAQTTIPFYGFELSNYEVGDTLEYMTITYTGSSPSCFGKEVRVVINKQSIGLDTIYYTFKIIYVIQCLSSPDLTQGIDTIILLITNDTIINNTNNVLQVNLPAYDSIFNGNFVYDTVNNLKHVDAYVEGFEWSYGYDATQNLGISGYHFNTTDSTVMNYSYILIYAHLQHYGVQGQYQPIYLNTKAILKQNDLVVNYNDENKTLQIKSNTHLTGLIKLYDVLGRCVLSSDVNDKEFYVGNLTTGIYFYNVTGNKAASGKILIR